MLGFGNKVPATLTEMTRWSTVSTEAGQGGAVKEVVKDLEKHMQ